MKTLSSVFTLAVLGLGVYGYLGLGAFMLGGFGAETSIIFGDEFSYIQPAHLLSIGIAGASLLASKFAKNQKEGKPVFSGMTWKDDGLGAVSTVAFSSIGAAMHLYGGHDVFAWVPVPIV